MLLNYCKWVFGMVLCLAMGYVLPIPEPKDDISFLFQFVLNFPRPKNQLKIINFFQPKIV